MPNDIPNIIFINYPNIKEEHCLEVRGEGLCFPLGMGDPLLLIDCEMDRFLHKLFLGNETN